MPLDEIGVGVFRFLGQLFVEIVVQIFFEVVCYWVGYGALKIITFGAYPKPNTTEQPDIYICIFGLIVIGTLVFAVMALI